MGIDDQVAGIHKAEADKIQRRLRYLEEAKATIRIYRNSFAEFYLSLVRNHVRATPIVELTETIPGQRFTAQIVGHAWQYHGLLIMPDGTFTHAPVTARDVGIGDWAVRGRAVDRAAEEAGVSGPRITVAPGYHFEEVDWKKSLQPVLPSRESDMNFLVVQGLGMTLAMRRNNLGELSAPGHLNTVDGYSTSSLATDFAKWIVKVQQPHPQRPAPEPFVPAPLPRPSFSDKPPNHADKRHRPEPAKKPTGGAWKRTKGAAGGLFVGLLVGAFIGFALSMPIHMNGGGLAAPITAFAITAIGGVLGLIGGLNL